jgi:hypothetical protein
MKKIIIQTIYILLLACVSSAGVKTWVGGIGTGGQIYQWNRAANWSPTGVPTSSDSVVIPLTSYNPVNMNSTPGTCGALTLNGGSITLSGALVISSGSLHGGHLNIISGTLAVVTQTVTISGNATVNGSITYTTGRINVAGIFTRNNLSGTGIKVLFSANNYINITTSGITSITLQAHPNSYPPHITGSQDTTKVVKRYYTILSVTGIGEARPRFDYLASEMGSSFTPTNANVWQYKTSGAWVNNGVYNALAYYAEPEFPLRESDLIGDYAITDAGTALPVQLASFAASYLNDEGVQIVWTTISEINNYGFYVERKAEQEENFTELPNSFREGHGSTLEPQDYSFMDSSIPQAGVYFYRLRQEDNDGLISYSQVVSISVSTLSVREEGPIEFRLHQNYPNPFNPTTAIKFSVEKVENVKVVVYNMLGQEVALLFDDVAEPGYYYTVEFNGASLSSGIYFYRILTDSQSELKKMQLVK